MKRDQAVEFLKKLKSKVPGIQARSNWAVGSCPLGPWRHEDGKSSPEVFGIRCEDGDSFCNCFSCGWHGSQSDLIIEMKRLNKDHPAGLFPFGGLLQLVADAEEQSEIPGLNSPDIEEMLFGDKVGPHIFPEWWLDTFIKWHEAPFAIAYLKERGMAQGIAEMLDIRADTKEKRVCFPIRNFKGELVGLHGRVCDDVTQPRYRMYLNQGRNNPIFWMNEERVNLDKPLVVVEGPMDIASVMRVYRNVASPLFSNPNMKKMHRMGDASEIVSFLDRGTGGDLGRLKIEKAYPEATITHIHPPTGCKDPGACTVDQLIELLKDQVELDEIIE